ncbi:MAG: hypothetical protein SO401_01720 [Blautia sp.]|nr:hypothetical protein [Blautia sp.]
MTKIKNTKKGMAKKTLSISLVAAMLATSNVPVWAGEFSDGSDGAFASEAAPVVEETADVPVAQAVGDAWTIKLTDMPTEVEWGTTSKDVTVEVKDVDGKDVTKTSGLKYFWRDSEGLQVPGTNVSPLTSNKIPVPEFKSSDVGKSFSLYIYDENGDFTYTSSAVTVGAKDVSKLGCKINVSNRAYTGLETKKDATITDAPEDVKFDIDYTGDLINAGTVKVTATPVGTNLYKGIIENSFEIIKTEVEKFATATMATKEFTYTGDPVTLQKSDVNVVDKYTNDNLNSTVEKVSTTAKDVREGYQATVELKVPADNKNFKENSTATLKTTDTFKVVARDLSGVKVTVKSQGKKPDGDAFAATDFGRDDVTFTDAEGKPLNLWNDIQLVVPANVKDFGTYTFTIKPKTKNVTGETTAQFSIFSQDISGAKFEKDIPDQEYTGSQIKPDLSKLGKLTLNDKELDPADYTIEYGENVNAGTGYVYIVGQRTYEGSKAEIPFTINQATANKAEVAEYVLLNKDAKHASDYAEAINLVVKGSNKANQEFTLKEGTDYTVEYSFASKNAADNYITVKVNVKNGNFVSKTLTKKVRIANTIIKDSDIQLKKNSYDYTGAVIVPEFDVVVDGKTLVKGTDYEIVTIENSAKAGTATVIIRGKGEYDKVITAKANFEVVPVSAEKIEATVSGKYTYNGKQQKPESANITANLSGTDVISQFDISYGENINAGKGTVILTPKKDNKNFIEGTVKTVEFDINPAVLKGSIKVYNEKGILLDNTKLPEFEYDGTEKTFAKVVFTPSVTTPVTDNDYEIKYLNNVTGDGSCIAVIAKGNYTGSETVKDNSGETPVDVKVAGKVKFTIKSKEYFTQKEVTVTDAEYAEGVAVKPVIVVKDGAKVLVEGKDYTVTLTPAAGAASVGATGTWEVTGKGVYAYNKEEYPDRNTATGSWNVVKKNVANLDIKVDLDAKGNVVVTAMNGNIKVDSKNFDVKLSEDKKTATVSATTGNKHYIGSTEVTVGGEAAFIEAPVISNVKVSGNQATVILSGDCDGATGYDYVISKDRDCITNKDYDKVNKNILKTQTGFTYTQQGVYYAYCHAWKRGEDGKKIFSDWSNAYPFVVTAITPDQPVITSVKVSGSTVTVTYTKAANAEGYDVVLGTKVATVAGEKRPVEYGTLVKKNIKGNTVTATFKNVKKGTYYAGLHAFNRTSEDGKKVFSPWSNSKKVVVK